MKFKRPTPKATHKALLTEALFMTSAGLHGIDDPCTLDAFECYQDARDAYLSECRYDPEAPAGPITKEAFVQAYRKLCDASGYYFDDGCEGGHLEICELDEDYSRTLNALQHYAARSDA